MGTLDLTVNGMSALFGTYCIDHFLDIEMNRIMKQGTINHGNHATSTTSITIITTININTTIIIIIIIINIAIKLINGYLTI